MNERVAITRALISVWDKTGLSDLARALADARVEIVATGSAADYIQAAGLSVTRMEEVTGFPEYPPFELLVFNLYPFSDAAVPGATPEDCVKLIDVGGLAMARAAAKNHASVAVVTSPGRYPDVVTALGSGGFSLEQRRRLAAAAYTYTVSYDIAVASWFASVYAPDETAIKTGWPDVIGAVWRRRDLLRYGENPHQRAALYTRGDGDGIASAELLHGKPMSYNNYADADAARRACFEFGEPCVAIIKHRDPCGIAVGSSVAQAHAKALACDPLSAFDGVIAANRVVSGELAAQIAETVTDVVIAPDFTPEALSVLARRKNIRLLRCAAPAGAATWEMRPVSGGMLVQSPDLIDAPGDDPSSWSLVAGPGASDADLADLGFAWRACRAVKSNAILLACGGASVGIGMGQVNRVDAARLAVWRAGDRAADSVAASDDIFLFPDGLETLTAAGVRAIVEPGDSIRDHEVIAAAQSAGVTLYFTGVRHFCH